MSSSHILKTVLFTKRETSYVKRDSIKGLGKFSYICKTNLTCRGSYDKIRKTNSNQKTK